MNSIDKHWEQLEENREIIDRVENCIQNNSDTNDWEDQFLESIQNQLMEGRKLSSRQLTQLEKIEYLVEWGRDAYWEVYGGMEY